jgi:hypothetical protein
MGAKVTITLDNLRDAQLIKAAVEEAFARYQDESKPASGLGPAARQEHGKLAMDYERILRIAF